MMMIEYPALAGHVQRYADLVGEPLQITVRLRVGARLAGYDALLLDNLLARCVVDEATHGALLPNITDAYVLPVPLRCLWRSPEGLPLWAATPFHPIGDQVSDVTYWHKRGQTGTMTGTPKGTFSVFRNKGRFMERRVPLPTVVCATFAATCIGDGAEIARLLETVPFVGKRRSMGMGEVESWEVTQGTFELVEDGQLTRNLPVAALPLLNGMRPDGEPSPIGWTPPQWKPSLFALGWREWTPVHGIDAVRSESAGAT